jgi:hypothetical protein
MISQDRYQFDTSQTDRFTSVLGDRQKQRQYNEAAVVVVAHVQIVEQGAEEGPCETYKNEIDAKACHLSEVGGLPVLCEAGLGFVNCNFQVFFVVCYVQVEWRRLGLVGFGSVELSILYSAFGIGPGKRFLAWLCSDHVGTDMGLAWFALVLVVGCREDLQCLGFDPRNISTIQDLQTGFGSGVAGFIARVSYRGRG